MKKNWLEKNNIRRHCFGTVLYRQDITRWHLKKAWLLGKLAFITYNTHVTQLNMKI